MSVVGRIARRVGGFIGRVHGRVFRALGSIPLVGGLFKGIGKLTAGGLGLLAKLSPLSLMGLGAFDPASQFLGGFSQSSLAEQNGRPQQNIGNSFNNMYGPPHYGGGYGGGYGYGMPPGGWAGTGGFHGSYGNHPGYGMMPSYGMPPFGMPPFGTGNTININFGNQCCCCGYRRF